MIEFSFFKLRLADDNMLSFSFKVETNNYIYTRQSLKIKSRRTTYSVIVTPCSISCTSTSTFQNT